VKEAIGFISEPLLTAEFIQDMILLEEALAVALVATVRLEIAGCFFCG
jgi:hypothetical protein